MKRLPCLFFLLFACGPALSAEAPCYEVMADGRDRSAYQYVNGRFLVFADPAWTENPVVEDIRFVDTKTRKAEAAPRLNPGNFIPRRPWGGLCFHHIPAGKTLSLRAGGKSLTFRRGNAGTGCPRLNFLLDGRWNGYEVLTEMPLGFRTLVRYVHIEGKRIIVVGPAYFSEAKAEVYRIGEPSQPGRSYEIEMLAASQMVERFPHLRQQINAQWGFGSSYFLLAPLSPGEEVKISGRLPLDETPVSFFVRTVPEGAAR
jgi:hypothetical protein